MIRRRKVAKCVPRVAQPVRPIYNGHQLSRLEALAQIRQMLVLFQCDQDDFLAGGSPNPPTEDRDLESQCGDAADRRVRAAGIERAHVLERRAIGLRIENQEVALAGFCEVFYFVIDDVVKADAPHHLQLGRAIDSRDVDVLQLGKLDADRPDATSRPIDQDLLARLERPVR